MSSSGSWWLTANVYGETCSDNSKKNFSFSKKNFCFLSCTLTFLSKKNYSYQKRTIRYARWILSQKRTFLSQKRTIFKQPLPLKKQINMYKYFIVNILCFFICFEGALSFPGSGSVSSFTDTTVERMIVFIEFRCTYHIFVSNTFVSYKHVS